MFVVHIQTCLILRSEITQQPSWPISTYWYHCFLGALPAIPSPTITFIKRYFFPAQINTANGQQHSQASNHPPVQLFSMEDSKKLPIAIALILRMQDLVEKSSPWRIPQTSWLHLLHLIHLIHLNLIVNLFRLINLIHLTHLVGTVDFDHLDPKATFLSNAHPRLLNSSWLSYKEKFKRFFVWKIILQGALKRQGNMTRYIILYEKLHKSNHWTQKVTIHYNNSSISLNVLLNCCQECSVLHFSVV